MILQEYFSSGDAGETSTALQVCNPFALPCHSPVPMCLGVRPWCCTSNLLARASLHGRCAHTSGVPARAQELQQPGLHHLFVKRLVGRALDRHNREREMASALLSSLYSQARPRRRTGTTNTAIPPVPRSRTP